jgi:hypothetical protein
VIISCFMWHETSPVNRFERFSDIQNGGLHSKQLMVTKWRPPAIRVGMGGGEGVPGGRLRESEKEDLKAGDPETGQA